MIVVFTAQQSFPISVSITLFFFSLCADSILYYPYRDVTLSTLEKIAHALDVSIRDLIDDATSPSSDSI